MADHVTATCAREAKVTSTGTRTTAILFPLRLEARPCLQALRCAKGARHGRLTAWRAKSQANDRLLVQTGVGRRRTIAALDALSSKIPLNTVISAGFAGALSPELRIGDVLAATHVLDETLVSIQATWLPQGVEQGRFLTMSRVIGNPAEKRQLYARYQALAVDMESVFVGQWCLERAIQFGVIRAITDDAGTAITPAVARLVSNKPWSVMAGVLGVACNPRQSIRDIWRLRRNAVIAGERLAEVLCQALRGTAC